MVVISGKEYPINLENMLFAAINLEDILFAAIKQKATDIHINVNDTPRIRTDGQLIRITEKAINLKQCQAILDEIFEHNTLKKSELHKEKRISYSFSRSNLGRFRATISSQRGSFGIVIRTLAHEPIKYEELGLPDNSNAFVENTKGLYIITGTSASGRSTTLASIIDKINRERTLHITTIENPIESYRITMPCWAPQ